MYRSIDSSSAQQAFVGRIDDHIGLYISIPLTFELKSQEMEAKGWEEKIHLEQSNVAWSCQPLPELIKGGDGLPRHMLTRALSDSSYPY